MKDYFKEEQNMDRNFLILLLVSGFMCMGIVLATTLTTDSDDKNGLIYVLVGLIALYAGIFWLMNSMKMVTKVDREGIHMKYFPFTRKFKTFYFSDMESLEVKRGKLLKDFGGWGYGKGMGKKKAYTTKGDFGALLQMKNGKTIFVGTQKPKLLEKALKDAQGYGKATT